ncbi:MAG TPA: glycine cleavage system aminomethyltransferase GcvT [Acidimicrobiia bacterium]|nr:glycine cleavage system aminomethyltransferase GcvT [Acidimicrobiia bacterium]
MNRSPLHELNGTLGARFVDFGGWEMPVQYESVLGEHRAVRNSVGIFDVTHLGRFELSGSGARDSVSKLLCNDIGKIEPGRCQYTMMLNEHGGIVDDLIVWWWEPELFWVMPNAANQDRVMSAFDEHPTNEVVDLQKSTVFLAVQGPDAPALVEKVVGTTPARFRTTYVEWHGVDLAMAGTGYTGEPGAEICVSSDMGASLFETFVQGGATPCGLGARDTLRLEAGLPLWGEDIDESTTPYEAGLDFAVSLDHDFIGRDALAAQREAGLDRKLTGFVLDEKGIPRHGYPVATAGGGEGTVTSGNLSPILDTGVGLGYIAPPPQEAEEMYVTIRNREVRGHLAKPPFHTS